MNIIQTKTKNYFQDVQGNEIVIKTQKSLYEIMFYATIQDIYSKFDNDIRLFVFAVHLAAEQNFNDIVYLKVAVLKGEIYVSVFADTKIYKFNSKQFLKIDNPVSFFNYAGALEEYNHFDNFISFYHIYELKKIDFEIQFFFNSGLLIVQLLALGEHGYVSKKRMLIDDFDNIL